MIIQDKDIEEAKATLDKIRKDFDQWKHVSITKDLPKDYSISYFHVQAILELKLLEVRSMMGNARQKEYRWQAGDPTLIMARQFLETTEDIKQGKIEKTPEYTYDEKILAIRSLIGLSNIEDKIRLNDAQMKKLIRVIEYINEHEWDTKFHELIKIINEKE